MDDIYERLNVLTQQMVVMQKLLVNVQSLVANQRTGAVRTVEKIRIVPVKNISQEQLYYAYKLGLRDEQLVELSGNKYNIEQIIAKLKKEHQKQSESNFR